jgi:hypothetical protein
MIVHLNKRYVSKDGIVTGPLESSDNSAYPFRDPISGNTFTCSGHFYYHAYNQPDNKDLVSEYTEPQSVVVDVKPVIDPGEGWRLITNVNELPHPSAQILSVYNLKPVWEDRPSHYKCATYKHGRLYRVPNTVSVITKLTPSPILHSVITVNSYV